MTVSAAKTIRFALTGALGVALLAGASGGTAAPSVQRSVEQAQAALAKGKPDRAILIAEQAVTATPRESALRAVLAQAYLKAGRFEAAATTFEDAIELGDDSARTALGLSLAHAGCGRDQDALAILDQHRDKIPAEDFGLALALSGETGRGVAVLTDALRAGPTTPKLRQNLAYAYALDGRWAEARLMAQQDVPADQVGVRLTEWAAQSRPEDHQRRVAALLGAPVVADTGQPQYLALADVVAPVQAVAAPVEVDASVQAAASPVEVPAVAEAETPSAFVTAFARPNFVSQPMVQAVPAPRAAQPAQPVLRAAMARAKSATTKPVRAQAAPTAVAAGTHRVQLGAFNSAQSAQRAVQVLAARNPALRGRLTVTAAVVNGKNYWRVAAAGFDAGSARSMCSTVKARGGACFAYAAPQGRSGLALAQR